MGNSLSSTDLTMDNLVLSSVTRRKLGLIGSKDTCKLDEDSFDDLESLVSRMTDEDELSQVSKKDISEGKRNKFGLEILQRCGVNFVLDQQNNTFRNPNNLCVAIGERIDLVENLGKLSQKIKISTQKKYLIFQGKINPGKQNKLHILLSSFNNDPAALTKRIESHPDEIIMYDEKCRTPFIYACKIEKLSTQVLENMLRVCPKSISFPDLNGSYPLHHYVSSKSAVTSMVLKLIKAFPDALMYQNQFGGTPASIAICDGNSSVETDDLILALLNANPRVAKIPNKHGYYLLHYIGRNTKIKSSTIDFLISLHPEALYERNIYGATPIFLAMYWDAPMETIRNLLEAAPSAVSIRDERGLCTISSAWNLFVRKTKVDAENKTNRVLGNREMMQRAELPFDLEGEVGSWWEKMELLLKASYHNTIAKLPEQKQWKILHATVGGNSPPNLIRFATKLYRNQLFLKDEDGRLPLHIAARNEIYVSQSFEPKHKGVPMLALLAHINRNAVTDKDNDGRIPLHIALEAGKTWGDGISQMIQHIPQILRERDPITNLYPFMLSAIAFEQSSELNQKCNKIAQGQFKQKDWRMMTVHERYHQIERIMEQSDSDKFNTVYLLLRSAPDALTRAVEGYSDDKEKVRLRKSNDKLKKQIAEMHQASLKLKQIIQSKQKLLLKTETNEQSKKISGFSKNKENIIPMHSAAIISN